MHVVRIADHPGRVWSCVLHNTTMPKQDVQAKHGARTGDGQYGSDGVRNRRVQLGKCVVRVGQQVDEGGGGKETRGEGISDAEPAGAHAGWGRPRREGERRKRANERAKEDDQNAQRRGRQRHAARH
jgi:hypothetical protein